MLKFNPDFAEAVSSLHFTLDPLVCQRGCVLHHLCDCFVLSSALPELSEQHESPGHLPVRPQSLALLRPPHLVRKRGKEQRGRGLRSKSPLRGSQPGEPALSLRPLVSKTRCGVSGGICSLHEDVFSSRSRLADLALQEAIRIAQESNDHVCLQHCLVKHTFLLLLMLLHW